MVQAVLPSVPLATQLCINYSYVPIFGRCRIESLVPGSAAANRLTRFHPVGKFILAINGTPVRAVEDAAGRFRFHLEHTHGLDSLTLLLVSMGVGENGSDLVDLAPHDHAQLRSIFSVDRSHHAPFLARIDRTGGRVDSLN
jgi:hypothetical protein